MNKDTGGPAFPSKVQMPDKSVFVSGFGMTLRDYFAAKAMQAWLSGWANDEPTPLRAKDMAETAYKCADAMLAERAK